MLDHAIRLVRGFTSCKPNKMFDVDNTEVASNYEYQVGFSPGKASWTTVPFCIQGEIAIVGTLIPSLLKVKPLGAVMLSG